MITVTILGANGFVGRAVCKTALDKGYAVRAVSRRDWATDLQVTKIIEPHPEQADDLFSESDWVVNCIGRAHVMDAEDEQAALARYRTVNRDLSLQLADKAERAGVTRFVQISSVAAVRSTSASGEIIDDSTNPSPDRLYGIAKLEADEALLARKNPSMRIACLRPPALLGPDPTGFVGKFARMAHKGVPLPLGAVRNARSFMAVANLADAALKAAAQGMQGAYIVTDSPPVSVAQLYHAMLKAAGYGHRIFPLPSSLLTVAANIALAARKDSLLGDAAYSGARFAKEAHWTPAIGMEQALEEMMASL